MEMLGQIQQCGCLILYKKSNRECRLEDQVFESTWSFFELVAKVNKKLRKTMIFCNVLRKVAFGCVNR